MWKSDARNGRSAGSQEAAHPDEQEYEQALARLAAAVGVAPGEIERRIAKAAARPINRECLTLIEIERYPKLEQLSPERQDHVARCADCRKFLAAISPGADEVKDFVHTAIASQTTDSATVR